MPFFFGGAGYVFGGWLSGRLMRAGWSLPKARKAAMLAGACLMPLAILTPLVPSASLSIVAICFVVFGHAIWIANLLTLPADLFERHQVGTGTGLSGTGGGLSAILATLGTGYVVTHFSYAPIFILAGLMHPMSFALILWLLPDRDFRRAI
jgi:MFS transporter, ACS family, hexuronate transporter